MKVRERSSVDASLGISRRTLLRRGAVVGGSLIWTAPVVHTLAVPSAAAGTPLDGISYVAVLLECNGQLYQLKWEVNGTLIGPDTGSFSRSLTNQPVQEGAPTGASASLEGETVVVSAPNCTLVKFEVKHGPCFVGPGTAGMPVVNTPGPWHFSPLASPPTC
jgi:hypothetical protein